MKWGLSIPRRPRRRIRLMQRRNRRIIIRSAQCPCPWEFSWFDRTLGRMCCWLGLCLMRLWLLLSCKSIAHYGTVLIVRQTSSGTGSIATTYMGVLLYTVAGLARKSSLLFEASDWPCSIQVHRFNGLSDCTIVCGRVDRLEDRLTTMTFDLAYASCHDQWMAETSRRVEKTKTSSSLLRSHESTSAFLFGHLNFHPLPPSSLHFLFISLAILRSQCRSISHI